MDVPREVVEQLAALYRHLLDAGTTDDRMMWKASGVHDALVALGRRDVAEEVVRPYAESGDFKIVSASQAGDPPPTGGWSEEFFRRLLEREPRKR